MLLLYIEQFDDERDKRLFAAMYERYERKLYAVALSILQVPAQAEDAVHDAFLKVIKHFDRAKEIPRQKIEGWLVIIVKNTALDMLRKARNSTSIEELWDVPSDVTPEGGIGVQPFGSGNSLHAGKLPGYPGNEICSGIQQR